MHTRLLLIAAVSLATANANVTLPSIFSEHAVLEKTAKVPVWGKADPGEEITITLDSAHAKATAGADGKWKTNLDLSKIGEGPFELIVEGKNKLTVNDVLVGEVWVCSGQSNMEWKVGQLTIAGEEIPQSANSKLRQFEAGGHVTNEKPQEALPGRWVIAGPENTANFTSVGYFFGKTLQNKLNTPVGLVLTAWGGTQVEPWIPREAFAADPDLQKGAEARITDLISYPERAQNYLTHYSEWHTKYGREDKPAKDAPTAKGWKPLAGAENLKNLGEPGVVWLQQTLVTPPEKANQTFDVHFRNLQGLDEVYWNGEKVGESNREKRLAGVDEGRYGIPGEKRPEGDSLLQIRLFNPEGHPAINGEITVGDVKVMEGWEIQTESVLPPLTPEAQAEMPTAPGRPSSPESTASYIYNAMVNPLIPYAIRGAIWYQGESNAGRAFQYRTAFPMMINAWRKQWDQGDFPFYFCQLANFMDKSAAPSESDWAELREAQTLTTSLPNTGQAILIDLGESVDIHPQRKAEVGERLAQIALAQTYGKKVPYSGPVFKDAKIDGNKIRVSFTGLEGGLVAQPVPETYPVHTANNLTAPLVRNSPNSELEGFAICGEDHKWVWADAKIEGNTVVVTSPEVSAPVAVRYAWANNPSGNLYNKAGLPAGPFRSDDFPTITQNNKY